MRALTISEIEAVSAAGTYADAAITANVIAGGAAAVAGYAALTGNVPVAAVAGAVAGSAALGAAVYSAMDYYTTR